MNLDASAKAVATCWHKVSYMLQGDMGFGKSSSLPMIGKLLSTSANTAKIKYVLCYVDCSNLDLGDVMLPDISEIRQKVTQANQAVGGKDAVELGKEVEEIIRKYVTYAPNEAFGIHLNVPVIIMLDEFGKANQSVQLALTRLIQERQLGNMKLPEGSIVYATTNKGSEGVGDMLRSHTCDRLTFLDLRKPTNMEWIDWAINNNINNY